MTSFVARTSASPSGEPCAFAGVDRVRRRIGDVAAQHDQRRALLLRLRRRERAEERVQILRVVDVLDVPAVRLEALALVLGRERERGGAVDRDVVVVVDVDEPAEPEVAGDRRRLRAEALHHVAVGADRVDPRVDDLVVRPVVAVGEEALRDRHADAVREALAERAGRRLDARRVPVLGVTRRARAPLAELLQVVEREVVAREVERRRTGGCRRGPPRGRSGRGRASADRPGCGAARRGRGGTRAAPAPSPCPGGRRSPSAPRPSRARESCRSSRCGDPRPLLCEHIASTDAVTASTLVRRVRPDRIQPPQGVLRRPALRRDLVLRRPRAAARARGPERRPARRRCCARSSARRRSRAARSRSRRARGSPCTTSAPRATAASRCASTPSRAPPTSSGSRRSCASSSRRWLAASTTTRRCAATARRRRGSSTPAAGTGATAPRRCSAGSASTTTTSTASSQTFSGGELTRASLGRALAGDPDLLLLDEPTNHLDVESLEWLERELTTIDAAVILVAHDRWFLESVTTAVLELEGGRGLYFSGPWHQWRLERAARAQAAAKSVQRVGADIERLEPLRGAVPLQEVEGEAGSGEADADRPARGGAQEGGRRAREPHAAPPHASASSSSSRRARAARSCEVDGLRLSAGGKPLLDGGSLVIERAEHIALVGPNGSGKTTLLETLMENRAAGCRRDPLRPRRRARLLLPARGRARRARDGARLRRRDDRARAAAGAAPARQVPLLGLRRAGEAGLGALGRRAPAARARRDRRLGREPPRARRADEPPRPREPRGARGGARGVPRLDPARLARPCPARRGRRAHGRGRGAHAALLRGRLGRPRPGARGADAAPPVAERAPKAAEGRRARRRRRRGRPSSSRSSAGSRRSSSTSRSSRRSSPRTGRTWTR